MRRTKVIVPTIVGAVIVCGIAVFGYADKPEGPPSLPKPLPVRVTGGIEGEGDPTQVQVKFLDASFGDLAKTYAANPDGPLEALGVRNGTRTLRYYYCVACSPDNVRCCDNPVHNPADYYSLIIYGGALEGKKETEQIVFPVGCNWEIRSKDPYGEIAAFGTLDTPVIYREHD